MGRGPNGQTKKRGKSSRPKPKGSKPREEARLQMAGLDTWPIVDCRINESWQSGMASIHLLKRNPRLDDYAFIAFLVDVRGLGLKDAFIRWHAGRQAFSRVMERLGRARAADLEVDDYEVPSFIGCPPELMVQLVVGGIHWARQNKFRTPPDIIEAAVTVLGATVINTPVDLGVFGRDGKPDLILTFEDAARFLEHPPELT